jgi:hypothetical protein
MIFVLLKKSNFKKQKSHGEFFKIQVLQAAKFTPKDSLSRAAPKCPSVAAISETQSARGTRQAHMDGFNA